MTKQQIIDHLAKRQGISKQLAKRAVDLVFEGMTHKNLREVAEWRSGGLEAFKSEATTVTQAGTRRRGRV